MTEARMPSSPCPNKDLGKATGHLVEAAVHLERAAEILHAVGWERDARFLDPVIRLLDAVMIELSMETQCQPIQEPRDTRAPVPAAVTG